MPTASRITTIDDGNHHPLSVGRLPPPPCAPSRSVDNLSSHNMHTSTLVTAWLVALVAAASTTPVLNDTTSVDAFHHLSETCAEDGFGGAVAAATDEAVARADTETTAEET